MTEEKETLFDVAKRVALDNGFGQADVIVFATFWTRRFDSWDKSYMQEWIDRIKKGTFVTYADSKTMYDYGMSVLKSIE